MTKKNTPRRGRRASTENLTTKRWTRATTEETAKWGEAKKILASGLARSGVNATITDAAFLRMAANAFASSVISGGIKSDVGFA